MRLPLRHPPPEDDPPLRRCAHLEALARALVGVPLGAAAEVLTSARSRGRHGNALQWHLGLRTHDGAAELDWEDRIEVKLVSVWARPDGGVACDKIKVCDLAVDPWHKLANVLFVFADRLTRVVVEAAFFHLGGPVRTRLANAWTADPHFDHPDLFVEARLQEGKSAPAYYLSQGWLRREGLLPRPQPGIFAFDAHWWNARRAEYGRDPRLVLVSRAQAHVRCPRCGGPMRIASEDLAARGWAPAWHGMPLGDRCATVGHFAVDRDRLRMSAIQSPDEFCAALEGRLDPEALWRVADRVPEPGDHLHELPSWPVRA